jgi:hypothetical protein
VSNADVVPYEDGERFIMGESLPEIEDSAAAQQAILRQISTAGDLGELFASRSTASAKSLEGIPLRVIDVRLRRSTIDEDDDPEGSGGGVYMLIDAERIEGGVPVTVNTGAPNIMMTLWRAKQLKNLPLECVVVAVGRARRGQNAPLGLVPYGQTKKAVEKAT